MKPFRIFAIGLFVSLIVISAFPQTVKYRPAPSNTSEGASAPPSQATETTIEQMPAKLETQFALSALPPALRDQATVYLLDPKKGYQLSRKGTSGVACLVERTAWEQANFRNDTYVPLCYDAEGSKTYLKVIMDVATLRIEGMSPAALKAEIENRYKNKTYQVPEKSGVSYLCRFLICHLPVCAQFLVEFLPAFLGEEYSAVLELNPPPGAWDVVGQPVRPFHVEIHIIRSPHDQRRCLQRLQPWFDGGAFAYCRTPPGSVGDHACAARWRPADTDICRWCRR